MKAMRTTADLANNLADLERYFLNAWKLITMINVLPLSYLGQQTNQHLLTQKTCYADTSGLP